MCNKTIPNLHNISSCRTLDLVAWPDFRWRLVKASNTQKETCLHNCHLYKFIYFTTDLMSYDTLFSEIFEYSLIKPLFIGALVQIALEFT